MGISPAVHIGCMFCLELEIVYKVKKTILKEIVVRVVFKNSLCTVLLDLILHR